MAKKKLLIILGAGASIEFGMPSVNEIDKLFDTWSQELIYIAKCNSSIYSYLRNIVSNYYNMQRDLTLKKSVNYEEMLFLMMRIASTFDDNKQNPLVPFLKLQTFPVIMKNKKEKCLDANDLRQLQAHLIDKLFEYLRNECIALDNTKKDELKTLQNFINKLKIKYDLGFVTLNHDNIIQQATQTELFTGFNKPNGQFDSKSVFSHNKFDFIYHLHGGINFQSVASDGDIHRICWENDLREVKRHNSSGSSGNTYAEEDSFLTSCIIEGYGKTSQILRQPFHTYFATLSKVIHDADAFMFIGYGFGDHHLNNCFYDVRRYKPGRPVVILTYANDNADPLQFRGDQWAWNLCKTVPTEMRNMATRKYKCVAPDIGDLKRDSLFETSNSKNYPLSVWYSGFMDAANNPDVVINELDYLSSLCHKRECFFRKY